MPKKYLITLILTAIVISAVLLGYTLSQSSIDVDELLAAPEQIEIQNRQYTLDSYIWRNFMPSPQPDRDSLIASVTINATDLQEFPSSINADKLWVIKSPGEIWGTAFTNENPTPLTITS